MTWDRYSLLWEIGKYMYQYDKNPPRLKGTQDLRLWLKRFFGWCPDRLGTLEVMEAVLWFLGGDNASPPKDLWCCPVDAFPNASMTTRRIPVTEIKRLRGEGETLQAIADIAGISRERVRQLLGKA